MQGTRELRARARARRRAVALLPWLTALTPAPALAQATKPAPVAPASAPDDSEIDPTAGTPRPAAPDQRAVHFYVDGKLGVLVPAGSVARTLGAHRVSSAGFAAGGALGIGLSRYVALQIDGAYGRLGAPGSCDGCSGTTLDLGLGLVYHLAQGFAFDPWISYGVGLRSTTFVVGPDDVDVLGGLAEARFVGVDVARIAVGGSFFPAPGFGFGPYLEADIGTYTGRPAIASPGACSADDPAASATERCDLGGSVHAFLQIGFRVALDPLAWTGGGARASARRPAWAPARGSF